MARATSRLNLKKSRTPFERARVSLFWPAGRLDRGQFFWRVQQFAVRIGRDQSGGLVDDLEHSILLDFADVDGLPGVLVLRVHHLGAAGGVELHAIDLGADL